jgi:hypothetical protein
MATTAERTDPELWETVKSEITKSDKGGEKGEWSARKAQLAVQEYKRRGGGYRGRKRSDNSLKQWTEEKWGTRSGAKSTETGERYLPRKAREALSKEEYERTTAKKRRDKAKGKQFSGQPHDVKEKTARYRHDSPAAREPTRADLEKEARRKGVEGRSQMSKDELKEVVSPSSNGASTKSAAAEDPRKQDLDEAARVLGVEGRSRMSKKDLRKAVAGALRKVDTDSLKKADLRDMALSFGVERTSRMSKGELHAAVRSALS